MNIKKINWKIYLDNEDKVEPEAWFRGFAHWIEDSPEVFVDAADYEHVQDGPLTVLVGHYCDYWLDHTGRRKGLLYNQRQNFEGDNKAQIQKSLKALLDTAERINNDKEFGEVQFNTAELTFMINDRLIAPNTAETFETVKKQLGEVLGEVEITHNDNPRERFSVTVKTGGAGSIKELATKLGV